MLRSFIAVVFVLVSLAASASAQTEPSVSMTVLRHNSGVSTFTPGGYTGTWYWRWCLPVDPLLPTCPDSYTQFEVNGPGEGSRTWWQRWNWGGTGSEATARYPDVIIEVVDAHPLYSPTANVLAQTRFTVPRPPAMRVRDITDTTVTVLLSEPLGWTLYAAGAIADPDREGLPEYYEIYRLHPVEKGCPKSSTYVCTGPGETLLEGLSPETTYTFHAYGLQSFHVSPVGYGDLEDLAPKQFGSVTFTTLPAREDGEDDGVGPVTNVQEVVNDEVEQAGGLEPGGGAVPIDVNKLFSNVGSGAAGRDFNARSSDERVVTVEITDNPHVVITPVGDGTATVTVGYTGGRSPISSSFGVAVGESRTATPQPPRPTPPSRVTGVRVTALDGGLRITWEAVTGEVSQYRVDVEDGDGRSRQVFTEADVLEALVEDLVNGVEYTVTVTALTEHPDVEGPASEPRTVTPPPSRVTGVRVTALDGGLRVTWEATAGEVSQYRVHAEDGDGRFRRVYTSADVLEALVEDLVNGVEYTVTVTALTEHPDVEGPASEPRTATPRAGGGDTEDVPVPALPLAGAGVLAGLLAAGAARRLRRVRRRRASG